MKREKRKTRSGSYDSLGSIPLNCYKTTKFSIAFTLCFLFWDTHLFQGKLRELPIKLDLTTAPGTRGYYKLVAWEDSKERIPGIWLSHSLLLQPLPEIMTNFVQLIGLHFRQHFGRPSTKAYYNTEYSQLMKSIGIQTSDSPTITKRKTGRRIFCHIIPGGLFEQVLHQLPTDCKFPLLPVPDMELLHTQKANGNEKITSAKNKTKYSCNHCSMSVWGKPNLFLKCGISDDRLVVIDDFGK